MAGSGIDRFEKSDELLMSVAFHATADHPALEDIEGGEQRRRAVSFVVMSHGPRASRLYRQSWLSSIECLNLALLVEREDEGVRRGIDIESDHIPELLSESRIARELEGFDPMLGEMMSTPDALDRTRTDADRLRHGGRRPMGGLMGRIGGGKRQHAVDLILSQRGDSRGAGLVTQQSGGSFRHETFLPAPDTGLESPRPMHDFDRADAVRRQKHDLCPPDMLLPRVAIADNRLELTPLRGGNGDGIPVRMRQTRTRPEAWESLLGFKCQIWSTSDRCGGLQPAAVVEAGIRSSSGRSIVVYGPRNRSSPPSPLRKSGCK